MLRFKGEPGAEQAKMPAVTCPTCGQHWPDPMATEAAAPEVNYEIHESTPMVQRLEDGTIITTEIVMKIEPAPPETGESNGSESSTG